MQRSDYIGGSDIAVIMGADAGEQKYKTFRTPLDVWNEKKTPVTAKNDDNFHLRYGRHAEPFILSEYALSYFDIRVVPDIELQHPTYKFLRGHLDGISVINEEVVCILEAKTAHFSKFKEWGAEESDQIPTPYLLQCTWYSMLYRAQYGVQLPVDCILLTPNGIKIYKIPFNEKLQTIIKLKAIEWWEKYVVGDTPPDPQSSAEINSFYEVKEQVREANLIMAETIKEIKEAKEKLKTLETEIEEKENKVKKFMKECNALCYNDATLATWKVFEREHFNVGDFKKAHPEIYKNYIQARDYRQFRVK